MDKVHFKNKFMRKELDNIAREKKIPYFYNHTKHDLLEKLSLTESTINTKRTPSISRAEIQILAKTKGLSNYLKTSKKDLVDQTTKTKKKTKR